ncbi:adenylyl-sulfate kinase [Noviherbaspirillum denitrificans]|uniref:Adenylyl-sulfate kinase n=1 Tax=Noviherbaspirillum denitrificans TaxID=1968433 RepID=A0A254TDJ8_9BURK|nr:adenylyl-sulfate kinase [Noviherbaspirillum denitrificans]OWW20684.1 adenylyl-sulfate kinase [Noviherbaspirillum denitrificans]
MASPATPSCYWITGLPAAGKTTLGRALVSELTKRQLQSFLLDGDELRRGLSADLGLSDKDRAENIRRAGEVARLMASARIRVVCAFVSPFAADRQRVRALFPHGAFAEIYLSTPLDVCAGRDPKGLYAKARRGEISALTGFDAPYEVPAAPEFEFDTSRTSVDDMLVRILGREA